MVFQFQIVDADIQRFKTQVWKIDISTLGVSVISRRHILHIQRLQGRLWLLHNKTANRIQLWFSVFPAGERQKNLRNKKKRCRGSGRSVLTDKHSWRLQCRFFFIFYFVLIRHKRSYSLFVCLFSNRQTDITCASRWRLNPDVHHPVKSPPHSTRRLVPQSFGFLLNKSAPLFGERASRENL